MDPDRLLADFGARRPAALARAISIVENQRPGFERLLAALHARVGRARRIGITGPPGAGKSTLTERLVQAYRARGLTVAVVAVDPTSPFSGGALLGDRVVCPWHGFDFDVSTGACDVAPDLSVTVYPVRVTDSEVLVELP